jgi:glycyl-tRNA synthetase alpha chain
MVKDSEGNLRKSKVKMKPDYSFQGVILSLQDFWAHQGALLEQPYDLELGAGTFHPATFFYSLGSKPWRVAYVQPSRRPKDSRYGENPNRLYRHYQYQVIIKPAPSDIQKLYLNSLEAIGIEVTKNDIRFVEDDWESPTLGASGIGWQIWLNGCEITQFTYFQQVGGVELKVIPVELTYGLERLAMVLQKVTHFKDILWNEKVKYGEIRQELESDQSRYNLEEASSEFLFKTYAQFEEECERLLEKELFWSAYEYVVKLSHLFNLLEARGVIGVSERTRYILKIRSKAAKCAQLYLKTRQE